MTQSLTLSLQDFLQKQYAFCSSNFHKKISQFFANDQFLLEELLDEWTWQETLLSEEKIAENWKCILAINFLSDFTQSGNSLVREKIQRLEKQPWNQSSQYLRSLVALNHSLAKLPVPEVGAHFLQSGAALIDLHEYSPWLALPYIPQHYEFGIFLALLALQTGREDLKENVLRLIKWQLNILDGSGNPLKGLFVREKDGGTAYSTCLSYLLFRIAAILSQESLYVNLSQEALKSFEQQVKEERELIHPIWGLIEKWLEQYSLPELKAFTLPEYIQDNSTALVGYRSSLQHIFCTLHGDQTGLGTLKCKEIEIISYGPQHFPLADCEGFGIEGNALSDQGIRRSTIEWKRQSFILKGCTRLVDQPLSSGTSFDCSVYRGIWLEVTQEYKHPHFALAINLLGLDGWDSIAFSFFVKAQECHLASQKIIYPLTLDSYEGESCSITFISHEAQVEIAPPNFKGKMQIIPLSGQTNFWGANFLVAYHLSSQQASYEWNIRTSD